MILRYCSFSSALYCIKTPVSWGVWIVSERVWMRSEGAWVWINAKYFENLYRPCLLIYCFLFQCPLICKNAYVWEVSGWCLWVSGSYLGVSGRCLVEYNVTKINSWIEVVISSYCLFSQWPPMNQKVLYFRGSVGCLNGVWKVSWECLSDSGWLWILSGSL